MRRTHRRDNCVHYRTFPGAGAAYLGRALYPLGFCAGTARAEHCRLPHREHRNRLAMVSSVRSHPNSLATACGFVLR